MLAQISDWTHFELVKVAYMVFGPLVGLILYLRFAFKQQSGDEDRRPYLCAGMMEEWQYRTPNARSTKPSGVIQTTGAAAGSNAFISVNAIRGCGWAFGGITA
jgi:hypothetical protein